MLGRLIEPTYSHLEGPTCDRCSKDRAVERALHRNQEVVVHYGTIASGNQVIKDGVARDMLSSELGGILCFEMEAAGLMNSFPCLVIRGICDYADSHKNKRWQPYAAATAAACAKELLLVIPTTEITKTSTVDEAAASFTSIEKECLQSLAFQDIESRRHNIDPALRDTCTWLFEHQNYCDWENGERRDEHHGLLWIKGKPGSGKSTLMKKALQRAEQSASCRHTSAHPSSHPIAVISFFFNARGSLLERTLLGLFRSLLHQLFQQIRFLLSGFLSIFQKKQDTLQKGWNWEQNELNEYFHSAIEQAKDTSIILFIDALDECSEQEDMRKIADFLKEITLSAFSAGCNLNICLSSRHYPNLHIPKCLEIRVEDFNKPDISKYVQVKLDFMAQVDHVFMNKIIMKASGVFLWAVLVVSKLSTAYSDAEPTRKLLQILDAIPADLNELFEQTIKAIPEEDQQEAARIMLWILFAERPLTPTELRFALAFSLPYKSQKECEASPEFVRDDEQMEKLLRTRSRGLIEVSKTENMVQFIHESVRAFLLQTNVFHIIDPSFSKGLVAKGHDQLERSCINYIKIEELLASDVEDDVDEYQHPNNLLRLEDRTRTYPFLLYATTSMFEHAAKAESMGVSQVHLQVLQDAAFKSWRYHSDLIAVCRYNRRHGSQTILLHIASLYGLFTCVDALLEQGEDANRIGGLYRTSLHAAAHGGFEKVVRLLVEKGAYVNMKDEHGWTALYQAVSEMHETVVQLLIEKGADVNMKNNNGKTALHKAASEGRETVAQLLIEKGADVKMKDNNGKAALHEAASNGHEKVIQLLIKKGADVNMKDKNGKRALHEAASRGHEMVIQLLIEKGAVINIKDNKGKIALHEAASKGHETAVQLLIEKGANINMKNNNGKTALHEAARTKHGTVMQLLVEKEADVNMKDNYGNTALYEAASKEYEMGIQLLIAGEADVNMENNSGETALHQATRKHGCEKLVQLLVERGANVNAKSLLGTTPLENAVGYEATLPLLIEKGVDVNRKNIYGETVLHRVARWRYGTTTMQLLIKGGADVNIKNGNGKTALHEAAREGHGITVQLLIEKGAVVNMKDRKGQTALHEAACLGHEIAVKLLIKNGADIDMKDNKGRTALDMTTRKAVVRLLTSLRSDL